MKKFLVFKITAFESGSTKSLNIEKVTCHWQSMCYETSPRFNISLREIISDSLSVRVMNKKMIKMSHEDFARVWDTLRC